MKWWIGLIFLISASVPLWTSEPRPLTDEQIEAWWGSINREERLDFIRRYDIVERTTPEFVLPRSAAIVVNQDVVVTFLAPVRLRIGHLDYLITLEEITYSDVVPRVSWQTSSVFRYAVVAGTVGTALAVITAMMWMFR